MSFKLFGGETINCRSCGKEVSTDVDVCPHCGEHLSEFKLFGADTIECRACGETISSDATVCPKCGEELAGFKIFGGDLVECRACGKKISTDAEVCPYCHEVLTGYKIFGGDLKECRACGEMVSTDAKVCPKCGEAFEGFKLFGGDLMECRACHRQISTDAVACPYCGEIYKDDVYSKQATAKYNRPDRPKITQHEDDSDHDALGKLIGYLVVIGFAVWGVIWLMKNIVGPLLIINISVILLMIGFSKRIVREIMFVLSFLAALLITADYKNWMATNWVVKDGVVSGIIPFCFYLNLIAGLVAAYLFIRDLLKKNSMPPVSEFTKGNVIVMSSIFVIGLAMILIPVSDPKQSNGHYLVNSANQVNYKVSDSTLTDVSYSIPPATTVDSTTVITPVQYSGRVGMLDANFTLSWYSDGRIDGSYTYPSRENSNYTLKGKDVGAGTIELTEYTDGVETAKCNLKIQDGCYVGKMNNTDGRSFNMFFCSIGDNRAQSLADSIALAETAKQVQPDIDIIRTEFQRINAASLQKVQIDNLTYYLENDQIVKIIGNCNTNNTQAHIEYYYKGEKVFFTYKIYKDLSLNEKDPGYKTEYRTYIKDDMAIKLLVNKDLKPWNNMQFDYSSIEYRTLEACKQNHSINLCN